MSQRTFIISTTLFIAVVESLLALQGFCMADEGWSLSGYQQVFGDEPDSVRYIFLFYNALCIGGLWEQLFGSWGIYGFRLLSVLFICASWLVVYATLRKHINRWALFTGIMLVLTCHDYGVMVFDHSSITVFLSLTSAFFIIRAVTRRRVMPAFLAGLVIGINIFSRIPNISQVALLIMFCIPFGRHKAFSKSAIKMLAGSIIGMLCGILIMVLFMTAVGHLHIFADNLTAGFSATSSADSSHNLSALISTYCNQYLQVAKDMVRVVLPPLMLVSFDNLMFLYAFSTLLLLTPFITRIFNFQSSIFNLQSSIFNPQSSILNLQFSIFNPLRPIALTALIMLYTLPLGSDFGINNMGENAVWLAAPAAVGIGMKLSHVGPRLLRLYLRFAVIAFCAIFVVMNGIHISRNAYFDPGPRTAKTHRISHPLATTYTTAAFASSTDAVLHELQHHVSPGDRLFCFQSRPMLHYLTRTKPYMHNPWPWSYDTAMMRLNLHEAELRTEAHHEPSPVLVREKTQMIDITQPDPDWDSADADDNFVHKNAKVQLIHDFIRRHNYHIVWENEQYQILRN